MGLYPWQLLLYWVLDKKYVLSIKPCDRLTSQPIRREKNSWYFVHKSNSKAHFSYIF